MAISYKLLITGPVGAGKTNALASISDMPPIKIEARAMDFSSGERSQTIVAVHYGLLGLGGDAKLHLYATPGRERFGFMWDIMNNGGIALILLIDDSRPAPLEDLQMYLETFKAFIDDHTLVVGVTNLRSDSFGMLGRYIQKLDELAVNAPVFSVDPNSRGDISELLESAVYRVDPTVKPMAESETTASV